MTVDFYFGLGSRYSYLAAMQVPAIERHTGVSFNWRPLYSPELIQRAGFAPFVDPLPSRQYDPAYRSLDAARWARLFGIPYIEPDFNGADLRTPALWCVAAAEVGEGQPMAEAIFRSVYGHGKVPHGDVELGELASSAGLTSKVLMAKVRNGEAEAAHRANIDAAFAAGAFGVPSFVTEDGELFFGQDRIPLLVDHLKQP